MGESASASTAAATTGQNAATQSSESAQATQAAATQESGGNENDNGENGTKENPPYDPTKHRHYERLHKSYPEAQFKSDDEVDEHLTRHLDTLEDYQQKNKDANKNLVEIFNSDPTLVGVLRDMTEGASFAEALARNVDLESLKVPEGDPDYPKWKENLEQRKKKQQEHDEFRAKYSENLDMSQKEVDEFAKENNLSEDDARAFLTTVDELLGEIFEGKITKKFLTMMRKAINYQGDIETAATAAKIAGKNEGIEQKVAKEKTKKEGDGLPGVTASNKAIEGEKKPTNWVAETFKNLSDKNLL